MFSVRNCLNRIEVFCEFIHKLVISRLAIGPIYGSCHFHYNKMMGHQTFSIQSMWKAKPNSYLERQMPSPNNNKSDQNIHNKLWLVPWSIHAHEILANYTSAEVRATKTVGWKVERTSVNYFIITSQATVLHMYIAHAQHNDTDQIHAVILNYFIVCIYSFYNRWRTFHAYQMHIYTALNIITLRSFDHHGEHRRVRKMMKTQNENKMAQKAASFSINERLFKWIGGAVHWHQMLFRTIFC